MDTLENVMRYYGTIIKNTKDLKSNACCCGDSLPEAHRKIVEEIDPEIRDKFYGCGSPIPPVLEGCTMLDLGCGTGRDAYLASKLVGDAGRVIGVDMTEEQLAVAQRHQKSQAARFGQAQSNVDLRLGYIENLSALGIADNSIDVVISNCVLNLSPEKDRVFSEIFRVLKPGGELYFSDVFAGRRVPENPHLPAKTPQRAFVTARTVQKKGSYLKYRSDRGTVRSDHQHVALKSG